MSEKPHRRSARRGRSALGSSSPRLLLLISRLTARESSFHLTLSHSLSNLEPQSKDQSLKGASRDHKIKARGLALLSYLLPSSRYELFLGHTRLIRIFTQLALVCLQRSPYIKSLPPSCEPKRTGDAVRAPLAPAMASNDLLVAAGFSTFHSKTRPFSEWLLMANFF
ncbi:hypothetical protein GGI43DRAFT_334548 [Trichoderma evansii]